jgi:hypothetical protein
MLLTDRIAVVVGIDRLPCCLYGRQLSLWRPLRSPASTPSPPTRRRQRLLLALLDEGEDLPALAAAHRFEHGTNALPGPG